MINLVEETQWISAVAGKPDDASTKECIHWTVEDALITVIVRECASGYGFRYVEYGVLTNRNGEKRFHWGEFSDYIRRKVFSALAERGNELAASALESLGPDDDDDV